MATCPLCNDTKTQELHGPTGFLTRNCPNCVVEEVAPAPVAEGTEAHASHELPPLAENLNLEGGEPNV